jgi:hypothetical protein
MVWRQESEDQEGTEKGHHYRNPRGNTHGVNKPLSGRHHQCLPGLSG